MTQVRLWYIVIISFTSLPLLAQRSPALPAYGDTYQLEVTQRKTTHLVFPEAIVSIDRGSPDILAQKAESAENILRVKAAVRQFEETNLSIITKSGKLYSFIVRYSSAPRYYSLQLDAPGSAPAFKAVSQFDTLVEAVLQQQQNRAGPRSRQPGVIMTLSGIYRYEDNLLLRIRLDNRSNMDIPVDGFRLFIRDRKNTPGTAAQEKEVLSLNRAAGSKVIVGGQSTNEVVLALPRLTLSKGKILAVETMEKGGGCHLVLRVKNRHLLNSQALEENRQ